MYKETRNYGFNLIAKDYAKFPQFLPMPCHIEHGWTPLEDALKSDLETSKPMMLVFSKRRSDAWKRASKVPVKIIGSPFIHFRNKNKITIKRTAKGTIVFPSHSTYDLKSDFSIENYCMEIKNLPERFQPVTICLFWLDYIDEKAEIYRKNGFKVVTAGSRLTNSYDFVKNFYGILSDYKYATSNEIGSYTFCSVEMEIPFFLTGKSPILINDGSKDVNVGARSEMEDFKIGKIATDLFKTGPIEEISIEQKKFVVDEMGINDCVSSMELNKLLWHYFKKNNFGTKNLFSYCVDTFITLVLFNSPWTSFLISIRKKLANK